MVTGSLTTISPLPPKVISLPAAEMASPEITSKVSVPASELMRDEVVPSVI